MSVYEKYVDRETDLLNTFNNSQGSWTDYANYYSGVKNTWDGLDYPLTAGGSTKYRLTPQEAADVFSQYGITTLEHLAIPLSGTVKGTSIEI